MLNLFIAVFSYFMHRKGPCVHHTDATYTEAVQTVAVEKAVGKPHQLLVEFAKFYKTNGQLAEVSK